MGDVLAVCSTHKGSSVGHDRGIYDAWRTEQVPSGSGTAFPVVFVSRCSERQNATYAAPERECLRA
jgi:hypothetical protein